MKKASIAKSAYSNNGTGNKKGTRYRSTGKTETAGINSSSDNSILKRTFTSLVFASVILLGSISFGQIAAWDFTGESNGSTSTAEIYNSHLDAGNMLTRGSGAAPSTATNSFRTTGFSNDGISVSNNDYFETTISAATGYILSLTTIDANLRGTTTFAASPGVSQQFAYSLDGTTFTLIGSAASVTGDGSGSASLSQISLSGVSALQNLAAGTTVTLRFYASGQTTTGGWGFYSGSSGTYGLSIGGTVAPTVVCNAPAPSATGATVNNGDGAHLTVVSAQGGEMSWYDAASGGTLMRHGLFYNTDPLTTTTTFWVDETVTGCPASPRTAVVATVLPAFNNLHLNGDLDVDGNATFDGDLQFNNIPELDSADFDSTTTILFTKGDGTVGKKPIIDVLAGIYKIPCKVNPLGVVTHPTWQNKTNLIYTLCSNVAIGVDSTIYKLDVRGLSYFSTGIRMGTKKASTEIAPNLAFIDIETDESKPFIRLSHKSGTSAPETRFRVDHNGQVHCTSVRVRLPSDIPVPDYVFKPEYQLTPLSELKSYVMINSHLPNIPSEAEIRANGLNMEEMQMKLLEKVEQLTLYVIQLEENNQKLEKRLLEIETKK